MKRVFIVKNAPLGESQPLSVDITSLLKNFKKEKNIELNLIISKSPNIPQEISSLCNKIYQIKSSTYSIKDNLKFSFKVFNILLKENRIKRIGLLQAIYPNSSLFGCVLFKLLHPSIKIIYEVRSPWIDMSVSQGYISPRASYFIDNFYTWMKKL